MNKFILNVNNNICLACAEEESIKSNYPNLYWLANKITTCKSTSICNKCKQQCNNKKSEISAQNIIKYI